jgi:hypothetical protein
LETKLQTDDFSNWIEHSLKLPELARRIRDIDISVYNLEGLRARMIWLIDDYISRQDRGTPKEKAPQRKKK